MKSPNEQNRLKLKEKILNNGREFKKGDPVEDEYRGTGIVSQVQSGYAIGYPVIVFLDCGGTETYTRDGKFSMTDLYPSLRHIDYVVKEEQSESKEKSTDKDYVHKYDPSQLERIATAAMQGILTSGIFVTKEIVAADSVRYAKALINQLNKES